METTEQKRPADIFAEALDYLWNGLGLEEKGWKRLKRATSSWRLCVWEQMAERFNIRQSSCSYDIMQTKSRKNY